MTPREFLGDEFYLKCIQDYEEIRKRLNAIADAGKPDQYQLAEVRLLKPWDKYYRSILFPKEKKS